MSVGAEEFADLMAGLGPFEAGPRLAVAVSGGADSLALMFLADEWVRARGGHALALTVDHGLRPSAAAEARKVGRWLKARDIPHRVLRWEGTKPKTGVQAAARQARYDLLTERCRREGILHLLLAHHQEDQAETFLLRLSRGSGLEGLAGMPRLAEREQVRLLRPLLGLSRARLRATLVCRGQAWLEDPSNENPAFARVRLRALLPMLAEEGLTPARLAAAAMCFGAFRARLDVTVAALLAKSASLYPEGYARLRREAFLAAPSEVGRFGLGRLLRLVGGAPYAPRLDRLDRLYKMLREERLGRGRTLGGCRVLPAGAGFLICREARAAGESLALRPAAELRWDGRFQVEVVAAKAASAKAKRIQALRLCRLGGEGWAEVVAARPELRACAIPSAVRPTLPAIWDRRGVLAVPHLGYGQDGAAGIILKRLVFASIPPLAGPTFSIV